MEEAIDGVLVSTANCGTRKRQRTNWWEKDRSEIEAPSDNNVYVLCKHSSKTLLCTDVRPNDFKKLRNRLYKVADKKRQDSIIASLVITKNITRRRPNNPNQNKSQSSCSFSTSYFITSSSGRRIPVCKNNFIAITKIGRTRLANIVTKVYVGEPIEEQRGERKRH
ncbi:hypothetical protein AVEN_31414-1 [Araneus ventricosus]|uniref:Uncharacterized protein n=1 Tax=Araneus ventricosus TaxID=182803 RepID=A0A4Y2EVX6_ARAVE|nr:hypothetical protein AVEN_31414-1 [Araneus ventricosus]